MFALFKANNFRVKRLKNAKIAGIQKNAEKVQNNEFTGLHSRLPVYIQKNAEKVQNNDFTGLHSRLAPYRRMQRKYRTMNLPVVYIYIYTYIYILDVRWMLDAECAGCSVLNVLDVEC